MRRLQNLGLAALGLVVLGLLASSVMGVAGKASPAAPASLPAGAVPEPPADRIQVEVLNASGRPGLAKDVMRYLRERGFDVVSTGNARPPDGTATRVLARTRDVRAAREVAESLHVATVATQVDTTLVLDASVVLGRDWVMPGSAAPNPPPAAAPATAPADPAVATSPTSAPAHPRAKAAPAGHAAPAPGHPK
ncbi:MAG: hypothetical protein JWM27_3688 [Gemmatimonadetes bacterium]|nr:hypothetical protein [Gemmatimonadota bacterium]